MQEQNGAGAGISELMPLPALFEKKQMAGVVFIIFTIAVSAG